MSHPDTLTLVASWLREYVKDEDPGSRGAKAALENADALDRVAEAIRELGGYRPKWTDGSMTRRQNEALREILGL